MEQNLVATGKLFEAITGAKSDKAVGSRRRPGEEPGDVGIPLAAKVAKNAGKPPLRR